jgi:hypothetical protein
LAGACALAVAGSAAAAVRLFAYDAADAETRRTAGGVTLEFRQRFNFNEPTRLRSNIGQASAPLRRAEDRDLGAPLETVIGGQAPERDLYEVVAQEEGADMMRAFCPGAARVWLSFGRIRAHQPLIVHVLGAPAGSPARLCHTLRFQFRGEWRLPPGRPRVPDNELKAPRFPY